MNNGPKVVLERLNTVISAWETLRPEATFGGMTLAQFREAVKPSFDTRSRMIEAEHQLSAAKTQRDDADAEALVLIKRVIFGVKADANAGEDSEIYKAMGYVRLSERRSGMVRAMATEPTTPDQESAAAK